MDLNQLRCDHGAPCSRLVFKYNDAALEVLPSAKRNDKYFFKLQLRVSYRLWRENAIEDCLYGATITKPTPVLNLHTVAVSEIITGSRVEKCVSKLVRWTSVEKVCFFFTTKWRFNPFVSHFVLSLNLPRSLWAGAGPRSLQRPQSKVLLQQGAEILPALQLRRMRG